MMRTIASFTLASAVAVTAVGVSGQTKPKTGEWTTYGRDSAPVKVTRLDR